MLVLLVLWLTGCRNNDGRMVIELSGQTMGTTYHITAVDPPVSRQVLLDAVEQKLAHVNARLSNWDPNAEVSQFSSLAQTAPVPVSADFAAVISTAAKVHEQSNGRFDVTLGPLINLWGFGPRKPGDPIPSAEAIRQALTRVGQSRLLRFDEAAQTLAKSSADVEVNLGAIAKGYGVDAVAASLRAAGVENYLVEIGGDLVTRGRNKNGQRWQIGIEKPVPDARAVQLIVPVSDFGLATSGDYRNFFEADGVRYSHIIDPATGRPINHRTTSVTVIAENAMLADAWATAMLVLGAKAGLAIANQQGLAVYFISRDAPDAGPTYSTNQSDAFSALLAASTAN